MPRNPRIFLHNGYYELCFRAERGLPLVCSPIIEAIFKGIVAKAGTLYPVKLCKLMMMGNHVHLGLVVQDPEHVHMFIGYIKRELAHAINRLLGRRRQTVWQEGYDAVIVLDTSKAVERSAYVYLNPSRANLVASINEYPGFTTWKSLKSNSCKLTAKRIPRDCIPRGATALSYTVQQQLTAAMLEAATEVNTVTIEPDAWLSSMPDGNEHNPGMIRQEIVKRVESQEFQLNRKRTVPVLGILELKRQCISLAHIPTKFGKKMICFGSIQKRRAAFIEWYKGECKLRLAMKKQFPPTEFFSRLPPGFFAPGGRLRGNLVPFLIPL